jgi:hypothetical protein
MPRTQPLQFSEQPGTPPGVIVANAVYRLDEAAARLDWDITAVLEVRKNGLPIRMIGNRPYVLGSDLIAFISAGLDSKDSPSTATRPEGVAS